MFTQRISMDCTREQYEKYLKDELLKMGYVEKAMYWGMSTPVFTNAANGVTGNMLDIRWEDKESYGRTYLGSFNAPLFLALAAMTDNFEGGYREYYVKDNEFYSMKESGFLGANGLFRKATKEEIMAKFGEPKKQDKTISVEISCDFSRLGEEIGKLYRRYTKHIMGEYYYCKSGDTEWVFISRGDKKHKTDFFCAMNLNSGFFDINCYIAPDKDIDYIRLATNDEKDILNKKMAEEGKYFDKDKCKIMLIEEKCSDLSEDTAQELLRLTNKLWKDVEDCHIKWLKERGYKILKPKTWEEV